MSTSTAVEPEIMDAAPAGERPPGNDQILAVAVQSGLELESAQSLQAAFAPMFAQAEDWRKKVETINITDASQVREMKLARETRLALREIRIHAEHTRKKLKEDSVRKGKAIDGVANVLKFLIEPLEARLLEQEQFAERQEAARKMKLKVDREEQLKPFGVDTTFYALADMPEDAFTALLDGSRAAHEAKLAAAKKAEEDRLARLKAEAEERERIRAENERLKREAEEREAAARAEREAAAAKLAEQKRLADEAAAAERAKAEAARLAAAEQARKEREELAAKARAEQERIEAENAKKLRQLAFEKAEFERKAAIERAEKEKLEQEAAALRETEARRVRLAAEQAAREAAAPDKEKLIIFAQAVRALELPEFSTETAKSLGKVVASQQIKFALWIEEKAGAL